MVKYIGIIGAFLFFHLSWSQEKSQAFFYLKKNSDKENQVKVDEQIDGSDVYTLKLGVHLNQKECEGYDLIKVIVTRNENGYEGVFEFSGNDVKNSKNESKEFPGLVAAFPRIVNYEKNPENGQGNFYQHSYKEFFNGNYYLSRKGIDYSTHDEVDSYNLYGYVAGYKIVGHEQKYINGTLQTFPIYSDPVYIIAPIHIKVLTDPNIEPMEKSSSVRDVNELKNIFGGKPSNASESEKEETKENTKEESSSSTFEEDVQDVCQCFEEVKEGKQKKMKCFMKQKQLSLKYKGEEKKTFISTTNACDTE